jgi:hypothetical protein
MVTHLKEKVRFVADLIEDPDVSADASVPDV